MRYGWAASGELVAMGTQRLARTATCASSRSGCTCPTLVIHGDDDRRVPYREGPGDRATLVPGAQLLTVGGGGHLTAARDPVAVQPRGARLRRRPPAHARPGCAR